MFNPHNDYKNLQEPIYFSLTRIFGICKIKQVREGIQIGYFSLILCHTSLLFLSKIGRLSRKLRILTNNIKSWHFVINKQKEDGLHTLNTKIIALDVLVEVIGLDEDLDNTRLLDLRQKSRCKWVLDVDKNSSFYHCLFGILADYDRIFLEKPFTMDEIKDVVWGCGKDKCPGLNGFHSIPIYLSEYRLINLIGCITKIISKILTSRIKKVIGFVVNFEPYIRGRSTMNDHLLELLGCSHGLNGFRAYMENLDNGHSLFIQGLWKKEEDKVILFPLLYISSSSRVSILLEEDNNHDIFEGIVMLNSGPIKMLKILKEFLLVFTLLLSSASSQKQCLPPLLEVSSMARWFKCLLGELLFLYHGMIVGRKLSRISLWILLIDKFNNKILMWKV
uniref:Uncharacterized protein n=1 Tax=Lactuca sativa TaxID=4236 RepID=A0A9R1VJD8_LACSA|nr:hypothetical protein LSAT_V11C500258620 [Lactuca sativa]